jgi:hypothetical protein
MAYNHDDDYKRGKLIRGLRKAEKPRIEEDEKDLLEVRHLGKIENFKEGVFKVGNESAAHSRRQKERRTAKRYKDLSCDYTKGR